MEDIGAFDVSEFLSEEDMEFAKKAMVYELEIAYAGQLSVPCYEILRFSIPESMPVEKVKNNVLKTLEDSGFKTLNVCMTTESVYEYLQSGFEVYHNEDFVKKELTKIKEISNV